jgi:sialate O-acetylesterase
MRNLLILAFLLLSVSLAAQLRFPSIISSGMVLQQNDSVLLWGWAAPGEKLYVIE